MLQKTGVFFSSKRKFLPLFTTIFLFFVAYALGAGLYTGMRDPQVFFNLFRNSPFLVISAVGMTFVILTGGIDLSVSGVIALTTVASAALLRNNGWNPWMVMLAMLAMGSALGAIMGAFITYLKVQPFIATLAGMWVTRGLCFFISDDAVRITDPVYRLLGQTKILIPGLADPVTKTGDYISILVILELVVVGVAFYLAHYTRFGRNVYAIGGNEQSARLMGLPVNSTKMIVYTLNGFCSALAGITLSIFVLSGHGLYATGMELTIIASVVIGGTMLTGGSGYVIGTLFGVLITGIIQTLIQFNGQLSSWWTNIVVGLLTLGFIGVQSLLSARKVRKVAATKALSQAKEPERQRARVKAARPGWLAGSRRRLAWGGGALLVVLASVLVFSSLQNAAGDAPGSATSSPQAACTLKPFRSAEAAALVKGGALLAYERNGGSSCIDEVYAIYADGRIVGDNGAGKLEKQVSPGEVDQLLAQIAGRGWFTANMYSTAHTPCGQCYSYNIEISYQGQDKSVKAVDGGTDAPADYWQVVSLINGVIPKFAP